MPTMDDLDAPPEDVAIVMGMVPRGHKTVIHQHPRYEEVLREVVGYCINIEGRRSYDVWASLSSILAERYSLQVAPATVKAWCVKYVLPNIVVPRSYVMKAIVEKGRSLDNLGELLELRDEMKEAYKTALASMYQHQTDGSGRIVRTGSNGTEVAALAKALIVAAKESQLELERYGIVPEQKAKPDARVAIDVNIAGAMGSLSGRRSAPIDVPFTDGKSR